MAIFKKNSPQMSEQVLSPFMRLQQEMNHAMRDIYDLFEPTSANLGTFEGMRISPPIDLIETKDCFKIEVEMPGMSEEDINVSFNENRLVIEGEKTTSKKDEKKDYVSREIQYGRYERSISLPLSADIEKATASFKKGMLWVTIPKKMSSQSSSKNIKIEKAK